MQIKRVLPFTLCLVTAAFALTATADELGDAGRAVFEQNKDAIISIRTVLSMNAGRGEDEQEREANAVIIGEDGLSVLSLTAVDPAVMMQRLYGSEAEIVSKVTSLKMILPDGKEIDGEVVLRDRDLDLVFIRPVEQPAEPMPHIDLENIGDAQVLENLLFIAQMGKVARRTHIAFLERVTGVVDKPVKFYLVGEDRSQAVACSPCFTLEGGFVGIGVLRAIQQNSAGAMGDNPIVIIAAAEDIKTALKQVPAWGEAPAEEAAPEVLEDSEESGNAEESEEEAAPEEEAGEEAPEEV